MKFLIYQILNSTSLKIWQNCTVFNDAERPASCTQPLLNFGNEWEPFIFQHHAFLFVLKLLVACSILIRNSSYSGSGCPNSRSAVIWLLSFFRGAHQTNVLDFVQKATHFKNQQDEWEWELFFVISVLVLASPAVKSCCRAEVKPVTKYTLQLIYILLYIDMYKAMRQSSYSL